MIRFMRRHPIATGVFGTLAGLMALVLLVRFVLLDFTGRPFCHKQIYQSLRYWDSEDESDFFPNASGKSRDSLAMLRDHLAVSVVEDSYQYVPGLREDDPGDLVVMYLPQATRWTWHGEFPPTIFTKKAWILVPLDFTIGDRPRSGPGELSERVSREELRQRLARTLDFIRTNERPHWPAVVAEHSRFLEGIAAAPE
jgi:hypothetical protein